VVARLRFEWDARKDAENRRKHGVSFLEAETVLYDDRALLTEDDGGDEHGEERFVLLGLSAGAANASGMSRVPGERFCDSHHFRAKGKPRRARAV
jgi:uncharacterized DUF497 family protein